MVATLLLVSNSSPHLRERTVILEVDANYVSIATLIQPSALSQDARKPKKPKKAPSFVVTEVYRDVSERSSD